MEPEDYWYELLINGSEEEQLEAEEMLKAMGLWGELEDVPEDAHLEGAYEDMTDLG